MNFVLEDLDGGWRITNVAAVVFPIVVMGGIFFIPESPRWLYKNKGRKVADAELKRLRQTNNVQFELQAIGDALEEDGYCSSSWCELLSPTIRRRVFIAMALQLLQQATGINPVFTYGGQIFKDVVGEGLMSLLIFQIVNFFSTIPAMLWVDRFGRRTLLLFGAVGMVIGHLISAISFTTGCHGDTDKNGCNKVAAWTMIVSTAFFIFNFAISWGPVCWIYPAEIFPMHLRAKAVSLSTMTNWTMGALMIGIPKLFPYLNINGVFFFFAVLCTCAGIFVYIFCPETKNMFLEDIEMLFNSRAFKTSDMTYI